MKKGVFIVIDGIGGTGKSTQLELLKGHLPSDTVFTHEPGGAPRAEKIRAILKEGDGQAVDPLADFFLFWAARAEHVATRIRPALSEGKIVVSDRFDSSTYAMQVIGEQKEDLESFFWECRKATLEGATPDCYIILDADASITEKRRAKRVPYEDRFDDRNAEYQARIREGYKEFAKKVGGSVIDAGRTPKEVDADIVNYIQRFIEK